MAKTSMFTRARLQLPLTPPERAALKFLQGSAASLVAAGLIAALPFLEQQTVDWRTVITVGAGAVFVTAAQTISKYFSAQGDNPAATLAGDVGTVIEHALPAAASKSAPVVPATPPVPVSAI